MVKSGTAAGQIPVLERVEVVPLTNFAIVSSSAFALVDASQPHGNRTFGKSLPDI